MFTTNLLMSLAISASIAGNGPLLNTQMSISGDSPAKNFNASMAVPVVPFYSQFSDIQSKKWQKVGCGIASLAMLIDFYHPGTVSVDKLLKEGIAADAYDPEDGWTHDGLIFLAQKYDLSGERFNFSASSTKEAFTELEKVLANGPVMASVHYNFDPKSPIPHLVVINRIASTTLYYNDPAEKSGNGEISVQKFMKAWKKRYITVRPKDIQAPADDASGKLSMAI